MTELQKRARRVEYNFAACEGAYWAFFCPVSGFLAVYLSHRGLNDTQIGLTSSVSSVCAIALQLLLSNYLDKHPKVLLKKLITILFLISIFCAACVSLVPMSTALMAMFFALCHAFANSNNGYLNAMLVQYNNVGIPATYGWPRGIGSILYAIAAFIYGQVAERYTPSILVPLFVVGTCITVICVLLMPDPNRIGVTPPKASTQKHTTYREMLSSNPTLLILLMCILINGIGNYGSFTFTLRVIERVGGGTAEFGISEFLRAGAEMPAAFAAAWTMRRFKPKTLVTAAFFFFGVRATVLALSTTIGMVYFASLLNLLCVGITLTSTVLMINAIVKPGETVRGQSLNMLCTTIGSIIGTYLGGVMISRLGLTAMMLVCSSFCFLSSVIMFFFCKPQEQLPAEA